MIPYLKLEMRRMVRDRRFVIFTVVMPVVYYLLFAHQASGNATGAALTPQGLPLAVSFMVGMAGFGALAGVLLSGGGVAADRTSGWLRQLRVTPVPTLGVVAGRVGAGTLLSLPGILAVFVVAATDQHVHLAATEWVGIAAVLWLGLLPFAPLGLAVGYLSTPQSSGPTLGFLLFGLSLLGGMWFSPQQLPSGLQTLATVLPTSHYAELAWHVAAGRWPAPGDVAVLAAWLAVFGAAATLAYRRAVMTR